MKEYVPASRPETIDQFADQPVMGVFDEGFKIQYPDWHVDGQRPQYHEYWAVAFPSEQIKDPAYQAVRSRLFPHDVQGIRIGNYYHSDPFGKLPRYMYPSGDLADVVPVSDEVVDLTVSPKLVLVGEEADAIGGKYMDSLLREQTVEPLLLVGSAAIAGFLNAYLTHSESGADKYMPSRETEYLLPRVDWDVLMMIVAGRMAGVPLDMLEIPEEHRYRVMACVATVIAHYYTESQREYDILRAPLSHFRDEDDQKLQVELSQPLHSVMGMFHHSYAMYYRTPYNPSLACLLYSYGIKPQEMVETVQQIWYAREHWNGIADRLPLNDLFEHYDQPPNTDNAKKFLAGLTPDQVAYYNTLIQSTVLMAVDPYKLMIDKPIK